MSEIETGQENQDTRAPAEKEKRERLFTKDYNLLLISAFGAILLNFSSVAVMSPFMLMLTDKAVFGGLMITAYAIAAIIARPLMGALSDKIGRMRLLIAGTLLMAVSTYCFSLTTALALLILIRVFSGLGYGMHSTCIGAAVADVLPKSRFAEGIGYFGLYATLGQMLGPAISIEIISGGKLSDYRNLFLILTALCLISAFVAMGVSYERKRRRSGNQQPARSGDRQTAEPAGPPEPAASPAPPRRPPSELPKTILGFEYAVFPPAAMGLFYMLGYAGVLSFITVFADWKDFGNAGLFFTVSAFGTLATRLFVGRLVDKYNADVVMIPALLLIVLCMYLLTVINNVVLFLALAILIGLANGTITPTINTILFKRCSPERRGTASAAYYSMIDLGVAAGAPVLGAIADATDYDFMYYVSGALCIISLVIYVLLASDRVYARKTGAAN